MHPECLQTPAVRWTKIDPKDLQHIRINAHATYTNTNKMLTRAHASTHACTHVSTHAHTCARGKHTRGCMHLHKHTNGLTKLSCAVWSGVGSWADVPEGPVALKAKQAAGLFGLTGRCPEWRPASHKAKCATRLFGLMGLCPEGRRFSPKDDHTGLCPETLPVSHKATRATGLSSFTSSFPSPFPVLERLFCGLVARVVRNIRVASTPGPKSQRSSPYA